MKTIQLLLIPALVAAPAFAARPKASPVQPAFAALPEKTLSGVASWYGGGKTANGEFCRSGDKTAAHKKLPFGTWVRVTDQKTGRSTVVRINDRGPYVEGRMIDLSHAAASEIGLTKKGIAKVKVEVLRPVAPGRFELAVAGRPAPAHSDWSALSLFFSSGEAVTMTL